MAKKKASAKAKTPTVAAKSVAPTLKTDLGAVYQVVSDVEVVIPGSRAFDHRIGGTVYSHVAENGDGHWIYRIDK